MWGGNGKKAEKLPEMSDTDTERIARLTHPLVQLAMEISGHRPTMAANLLLMAGQSMASFHAWKMKEAMSKVLPEELVERLIKELE